MQSGTALSKAAKAVDLVALGGLVENMTEDVVGNPLGSINWVKLIKKGLIPLVIVLYLLFGGDAETAEKAAGLAK